MTIAVRSLGNPRFLDIAEIELLSPAQCEQLVARLDPDAWTVARVTDYGATMVGTVDTNVRSTLSQPIPLDDAGWPLTEIMEVIANENAARWRYRLDGFDPVDYPSILRYEAGVMDHFARHIDVGEEHSTRKLSFSVQLSDPSTYRGGDLIIGNHVATRAQGTMVVFSSLLSHEVAPMLSGTRHALVGWIHGPAFA
jgi:PKHD-type hydroxylase